MLENPNYNANIKTFSFINQLYHLKFKTASVSLDEEGQTKAKLGNSPAEGLAAANAGYSSSTTNISYRGYSSSYGSVSAYGSGGSF